MGARLAAFSLLTCAAFAWPMPFLDRPGTAALGLAFAALTLGRATVAARPGNATPRRPAIFEPRKIEPVPASLEKTLAAYGLHGRNDDDAA